MKFRILTILAMVFLPFSADFGAGSNIDDRWSGKYSTGTRGIGYDQTICTDITETTCTDNPRFHFMAIDYAFKAYGSFLTGTSIGGSNYWRNPTCA